MQQIIKMSGFSKRIKKPKSMRPIRMWIDGASFNIRNRNRINDQSSSINSDETSDNHELFDIKPNDNGKLSTTFRVPSQYYQKLYSSPDFDIRYFQQSTKTEVTFPKNGKSGSVSIIGENFENVAHAREELHTLLGEIRNKFPPAQFISIPTLSEEVQSNFKKFKNELLNWRSDFPGLDESIFQKPEKLHLTVTMFCLLDDSEKEEAIRTLQAFKENVLDDQIKDKMPLRIRLQGIDCMKNNYAKAHVLYVKAKFLNEEDDWCLQKVANSIADCFYEKGFNKESQDNVTIHVTLMNTKYRNGHTNKRNRYQKRFPFDATRIMEKYRDYDFGTVNFDAIHLSLMASKGEDGFYKPLSIIKL